MDQVISEIVAQEADAPVAETPEIAVPEEEVEPKAEPPKQEDAPWPKKAQNALSRRDKEIGKLRAQLQQLQAQREAPPQNQPKSDRPKEADFQTYGEYLKADALYDMRQELAKDKEASKTEELSAKEREWMAERDMEIGQKTQEYMKAIPDYAEVAQENADILAEMPPHIQKAFYEADDAPMAFYNLAKEGKLEALASMSPYRAAMEIARAEMKKPVAQISKAPRPMQGATGKGPSSSSLDSKSPDELMKWLNS